MLRIAVAQTPGNRLDQWPKALGLIEDLIQRAADKNADLVLFPECVWPAYFIGSVDDFFRAREVGMPGDRWFLAQLAAWARTHRVGICAGYVAEHGRRLRNAACLIGPSGDALARYDKCFLWDFDHAFFETGESITPTSTEWGPVGLMICADARLPEIPATLAARGAGLILQPTAWVNVGTPEELWNPQPDFLVPERAREFGVPVASASKWGVEGEMTFVGSSLICDAGGNVVAQCGTSETNLIVADITPQSPQKPQLSPEQRARLLARQPAELPKANVPPLRVVFLGKPAETRATRELLAGMDARDAAVPTLLLACAPAPNASVADMDGGEKRLLLTGPTDQPHTVGAARVAAVRDQDAFGFAPIRALALAGVHLVIMFGENVSERTLRTRAAENRVFLVQVTSSGISGYDPRGSRVETASANAGAPPGTGAAAEALMLDVAQAADKEFAPRTNPFTQRRPEIFAF